jgi:hypothetical protein
MDAHELPPFRYYTDGEYEYRVERCLTDSGTTRTVSTGRGPSVIPWLPGTRMWKLADRPAVAPKIVIIDGCNPACVDDGSRVVKGQPVPPSNPWTHAADVFLPNADDDFDVAAKRLLGGELFAECERYHDLQVRVQS